MKAEYIERRLKRGADFPYDASDRWWDGSGMNPPKAKDWAHAAARGVIADLTDRNTIKWGFENVDEGTRREIVQMMAAIIRMAKGRDSE